jgi:preprotein translocase subunit SecF
MPEEQTEQKKRLKIIGFYERNYKKLLIFPFLLITLSVAIIFGNYFLTGEFFEKDVSLKGGATITVPSKLLDAEELHSYLSANFARGDINVRQLSSAEEKTGVIIDAGIKEEQLGELLNLTEQYTSVPRSQYTVRFIGSALGASFFREAFTAILVAFFLMSITVLLYFKFFGGVKAGVLIPSLFVVWTVFIDIICTFALLVLLNVKISTAGLAAFLMLIGYSIDTDILLTTRVLRSKEGRVFDRILGAARTGMTMTLTSFVAVFAAFFFSQSETIRQIMLVLSIGLVFDLINTWITNAGVLRWYLEKKRKEA